MGGSGRTRLIQLHYEKRDLVAFLIGIAAITCALCMSIFKVDQSVWKGVVTILS
jgi:hypothetical protein